MDTDEVLKDILSGDSTRVYTASWNIIKADKRQIATFPLGEIEKIHRAFKRESHQNNHAIPQLALNILNAGETGVCRCSVYTSSQRLLPEAEQDRGFVVIEKKSDIPWKPEFECACINCGKRYFVDENHSYHYDWAKWSEIS